jgi:hypothetical protein
MRGLAAAGDRAGALVQARIHETLLREELEAAPDPAISALAAELKAAPAVAAAPEPKVASTPVAIAPTAASSPPTPPTLEPAPLTRSSPIHNIPADVNSFVGRLHERADVAALLESSRLVTITGAGGSGKTRLSLQVARDRSSSFADGVSWIELADIADASIGRSVHRLAPRTRPAERELTALGRSPSICGIASCSSCSTTAST